MSASDPGLVVSEFVAAWNRMDFDAVVGALAENVHYHNVPMEPVLGRVAVTEYLRGAWRFDECQWTTHHQAVAGSTVLTEREDAFRFGSHWVRLPVMGVFEIDADGLIGRWRDYFDLASYQAQLAQGA